VHCGTATRNAVLSFQVAQSSPTASTTAEQNKNGYALAGFVLSFFGVIGWLFSLLGLIFSIMGLVKSKQVQVGKGFGIAGIVISVCAFFVHGVIMALIMPFLRLLAVPFFLFALLFCAV